MKAALVLAPWYRRESPAPDLGMAAALLKSRGHEVAVCDFNNHLFQENRRTRDYWKFLVANHSEDDADSFFARTRPLFEEYAARIAAARPDAAAFKVIGHTIENAAHLARALKARAPGLPVVFCGVLLPDRSLLDGFRLGQERWPYDYVLCGEDELALPAVLESVGRGAAPDLPRQGKVIDCLDGPHVQDLDSLPHFDFTDFDLSGFRMPDRLELFMSKGCPRRCSFCVDWKTERRYRCMSGRRIYEELAFQQRRHGIRHVTFCDKTIDGDVASLREFAEAMARPAAREELKGLTWSGDMMVRPELTPEFFGLLRAAGCGGLGFGIESGSDKVLKDMRKGFTAEQAEKTLAAARGAGIHVSVNILVGFPTEAREDFRETLAFVERARASTNEIRVTHLGCVVMEKADLHNDPGRFGLADASPEAWRSADGGNTHEERVRRFDELCDRVLKLDIPLRVNSRLTKTGRAVGR
ncbi:MAG: radical SAM protein [Elusimicrobia bacterium]|nr:radical SAM protein [Elusimicrobiota bacterium]